ncbi:retention module-containing protein, partial [Gammaproteobacteria bacterium AS21]
MAAIGIVSSLLGKVVAVDATGNERLLAIGDEVFEGEVIVASVDARIQIQMNSGDLVEVTNGQRWTPTIETFSTAEEIAIEDQVVAADDLASIESIQQALLAGLDPTEFGEATAAGAGAGAGAAGIAGDGGTSFVTIARTAGSIDPNAGFDTIASSANFPTTFVTPTQQLYPEITVDSITAVDSSTVVEGNELSFLITLSGFPVVGVTLPFSLGGTASIADYSGVRFSNDVINNGDGTILVPEGVTSFTVILPTIDDTEVEATETAVLTVGGVESTGTILDNDKPDVVSVSVNNADDSVVEGKNLEFTVTLSEATLSEVT